MSLLQSRWAKFMKLVFVFNNFMFLVIGLASIGFGLWGLIRGEKVFEEKWFPQIGDETLQQDLARNVKHAFAWLTIGAVILVGISFLGFCGGCRENRCILGVFFIILFVLTLVFLTALILFFAFPAIIVKGMDKAIEKERDDYLQKHDEGLKTNKTAKVSQNVDSMQKNLKCCLWNETIAEEHKIKSCYENWDDGADSKPSGAVFHTESCSTKFVEILKKYFASKKMTFALIVIITIFICVEQMILSLYICCKIKSQTYETMQ